MTDSVKFSAAMQSLSRLDVQNREASAPPTNQPAATATPTASIPALDRDPAVEVQEHREGAALLSAMARSGIGTGAEWVSAGSITDRSGS